MLVHGYMAQGQAAYDDCEELKPLAHAHGYARFNIPWMLLPLLPPALPAACFWLAPDHKL
jgi:hypothetical protein